MLRIEGRALTKAGWFLIVSERLTFQQRFDISNVFMGCRQEFDGSRRRANDLFSITYDPECNPEPDPVPGPAARLAQAAAEFPTTIPAAPPCPAGAPWRPPGFGRCAPAASPR